MAFLHRRPWLTPYLLLVPGLAWLAIFFVVPLGFLGYQSLESGSFETSYSFTWAFSNYWDVLTTYKEHFIRSFVYAGLATLLALVISYPLAYWIAFRGGRWKNLLLLIIVAPFFVTYLIRTLAWQTILADEGPVVGLLREVGILADDGRLLATSTAVVAGITYNFLPFMALPLYVSLEQIDPRLIEAAEDLYASRVKAFLQGHPAAVVTRSLCGHPAHLHPGGGGLHQRAAPRHAEAAHDRERDPIEVPRADRLSERRGALVHPDGRNPAHGRDLRPRAGDGEAHRMTTAAPSVAAPPAGPNVLSRAWAFVRRNVLTAYAILAFVYLMLPIAVVIAFSFNDPAGRFNYTWQGFTLDNWINWDAVPGLRDAVVLSLEVALIASLAATVLGTLIALALVRHSFRGRGATNLLIFLPMSTPEIVLGASLLALFLSMNAVLGFTTIVIAHIMFCISFVVVTVKARLIGFDRHLEEAAMDLGANEWTAFRKVTLPLIAPAILAGILLSFALSIDDFVITYFNAGPKVTFPLFVWGAARVGAPPQVNVIGTAIFVVALAVMLVTILWQFRRPRGTE